MKSCKFFIIGLFFLLTTSLFAATVTKTLKVKGMT